MFSMLLHFLALETFFSNLVYMQIFCFFVVFFLEAHTGVRSNTCLLSQGYAAVNDIVFFLFNDVFGHAKIILINQ